MNKYRNKKYKTGDGQVFDSYREYNRYFELKMLERAGEITELKRQVKFVLIPKQTDENGKLAERECSYFADFTYTDKDGKYVVEDAKGVRTKEYIIKRKLMLERHGIRVREI